MIMAYYRLGKQEDARRSMKQILRFAQEFRMDNPLVKFGSQVYQPDQATNCCYDTWGVPAAMIRGLFEYLYKADRLVILPHIPAGLSELSQRFPIRFGANKLFLSTVGSGPVTGVLVNGKPWSLFDAKSISLVYNDTPAVANIQILLGGAAASPQEPIRPDLDIPEDPPGSTAWESRLFPVISTNDMPLRWGQHETRGVQPVCRRPRTAAGLPPCPWTRKSLNWPRARPPNWTKIAALVGRWTFDGPKTIASPTRPIRSCRQRSSEPSKSWIRRTARRSISTAAATLKVSHHKRLTLTPDAPWPPGSAPTRSTRRHRESLISATPTPATPVT